MASWSKIPDAPDARPAGIDPLERVVHRTKTAFVQRLYSDHIEVCWRKRRSLFSPNDYNYWFLVVRF